MGTSVTWCRQPGLHFEHGSLSKYWKWVSGSPERHQSFLRSVKKYISGFISDPERRRLKGRKELEDKEELTKEHRVGKRLKENMTFVESSAFLKEYGKQRMDEAPEDHETIHGEVKKGVWVKGMVGDGKEGFYHFEFYDDTGLTHTKILDDGNDVLNKEQVQSKFNTMNTMRRTEQDRVSKGALSIDRLVKITAGASDAGDGSENDDSDSGDSGNAGSDGGSDDPGDDMDASDIMSGFVGGMSAASKAKAKAKAASVVATAKPPGELKRPASVGATPPSRKAHKGWRDGVLRADADQTAARDVVELDGRGERLKAGIQEDIDGVQQAYDKLLEITEDDGHSAEEVKAFQAAMRQRQKDASNVKTRLKGAAFKVDRSRNKEAFKVLSAQLTQMMTAISAVEDAVKVVLTPSMASDDVIVVIETCAKAGVRLSKAWQRKHLKALAEEAVKFANYDDLFIMMTPGSEVLAGLDEKDSCCGVVEDLTRQAFKSINVAKCKDPTDASRQHLVEFAQQSFQHSSVSDSLCNGLKDDIETLLHIADCVNVSVTQLLKQIDKVEQAESQPELSAIMTLLTKEAVGKALVEFARATAEDRGLEVELQQSFDELQKSLIDLKPLLNPIDEEAWDQLRPLCLLKENIETKIAEAKKKRGGWPRRFAEESQRARCGAQREGVVQCHGLLRRRLQGNLARLRSQARQRTVQRRRRHQHLQRH